MAEYEDGIFSNLPQRRGRAGDDNSARSFFRELRGYVPEGPLPPRPEHSGKGGPSINQGAAPPPVTSVWSASRRRRQQHDAQQRRADGHTAERCRRKVNTEFGKQNVR